MARKETVRRKSTSPTIKFFLAALMMALAFFILGPLLWLGAHAFVTNWTYPNLSKTLRLESPLPRRGIGGRKCLPIRPWKNQLEIR